MSTQLQLYLRESSLATYFPLIPLHNKPQSQKSGKHSHSNNVTLFHSTFEFFRRCFLKQKVDEAEQPGIPLQDEDEDTKLELVTGTAAEVERGNDVNTHLQPHAAEKLSWTSIMCNVSLVECEDCTGHWASTLKRDEHQDQATSGVSVWVTSGHWGGVEILVRVPAAPYRDRSYDNMLLL
jgi:hypothetical protein